MKPRRNEWRASGSATVCSAHSQPRRANRQAKLAPLPLLPSWPSFPTSGPSPLLLPFFLSVLFFFPKSGSRPQSALLIDNFSWASLRSPPSSLSRSLPKPGFLPSSPLIRTLLHSHCLLQSQPQPQPQSPPFILIPLIHPPPSRFVQHHYYRPPPPTVVASTTNPASYSIAFARSLALRPISSSVIYGVPPQEQPRLSQRLHQPRSQAGNQVAFGFSVLLLHHLVHCSVNRTNIPCTLV